MHLSVPDFYQPFPTPYFRSSLIAGIRQILTEAHRYFNNLFTTKARQLRSELRRLTKGSLMIEEFMVRVREISDSLILVRDPVPLRNLIEIVLDALPEEYDPIVVAVNSKEDLGSLDELE